MAPPVLFPDAVEVAIGCLVDEFEDRGEDVPVVPRVPRPRPDRFVLIRRVGGPRQDLVTDEPMLAVEAWAQSEEEAQDLAQLCRALLFAARGTIQGGVPVYRVTEVGGPGLLPDPISEQPRYSFTIALRLRGRSLAAGAIS